MTTTPTRPIPAQGQSPVADPELATFAALICAHRRGDRRGAMRIIRELRRLYRWSIRPLSPHEQGGDA
jgi:hypothetical protein